MLCYPNFLIIGSSARKAGKTTLATAVIRRYAREFPIVGIKISGWNQGTHGENRQASHVRQMETGYQIIESLSGGYANDTSRMKEAGALKSFWLITSQDYLIQGLTDLMTQLPSAAMILCESTSARFVVQPSAFILIQHASGPVKPYYALLESLADRIVPSEELNHFITEMPVIVKDGTWFIRNH